MNYYLICFILSALLTGVHLFKWKNQYGIHFSLMYIFATIANFGYWQIYDAKDVSQAILANKIAYVGGCFSNLSLMMCIFSVCKVEINKYLKLVLYAMTCFVYGTSITVGYSDIFYKNVSLELIDGKYVFMKEYGFFHTLFYVMLVSFVVISLIVLLIGFKKKDVVSFKSVRLMCIVMVSNFISFFLGRALFDVELIAASYVITELLVQVITNRIVRHNVDQLALTLMLENGEFGAAAFDYEYNFLGCNDVARKVYPKLGLLSVDKKIDKENKEFEEIVSWIDKMNDTNSFEKIFEFEDKFYRVFGQDLYIKKKKIGYNFTFMDYTKEKEHAEELIKVETKAKSDVLAQMSHEIRTPINAILGMNEMILRYTRDTQTKQYAEDVKRATNNLLEIVNEILDFSKLDSGKMELQCVEYNLANLVDDVVNMFTIRANDKNLKFITNVDETLPAFLYGDDIKIRQILANLLSNAVKYTQKGHIEFGITGTVENDKVNLHFKIKDTGIGIKPENMSKLFNEFERIEEKQNRGIVGTGLGMSITVRFLKMLNSTLKVDSVYGEGSEFYFDLEQGIVNYEILSDVRKKQKDKLSNDVYQRVFTAPEAKILVVDDNKMNLKVFCGILKETMIQIDEVESGEECLNMVQRNKYDLIFLDHMMPEMDGIETLHRMKVLENSKCKEVPVIVLTANAISGAKEYYLSEGFDDFMSKPFNPETLERMILDRLPENLIRYDEEINSSDNNMAEAHKEQKVVDCDNNELPYKEQKVVGCDNNELPYIEGMDWLYGLSHFNNNMEMFLEMVKEFYGSMNYEGVKLEKIYMELKEENAYKTVLEEDDKCQELFKRYRIQVHSMKSSANLIGAKELGELAAELEGAASRCDTSKILNSTEDFLEKWDVYRKRLEVVSEEEGEKQSFDVKVILQYFTDLKNAFEDFDIDKMDEIMKDINGFEYPEDILNDIRNLKAVVTDLDEDKGIPLIEMLISRFKMLI